MRLIASAAVLAASLAALPAAPMPATDSGRLRLVTETEHVKRLALLPQSEDGVLDRLAADPRLVWYDRATTPSVHQHWRPTDDSGFVFGLVASATNISANKAEPFGNANREFPWAATAGLAEGDPVLHFCVLPSPAPVRWAAGPTTASGRAWKYLEWTYPAGTVFGELLMTGDGSLACEVRLRRKGPAGWTATAYRPYPTAADLDAAVAARPRGLTLPVVVTRSAHPLRVPFSAAGAVDELPAMPAAEVRRLLGVKFKNALGSAWRDGAVPCHAPTTAAALGLVPRGYKAHAVEVSTKSCARCHDTVLQEAMTFDAGRDWYGMVRGSDTIFSLHPFDPKVAAAYYTPSPAFRQDVKGKLFTWD